MYVFEATTTSDTKFCNNFRFMKEIQSYVILNSQHTIYPAFHSVCTLQNYKLHLYRTTNLLKLSHYHWQNTID